MEWSCPPWEFTVFRMTMRNNFPGQISLWEHKPALKNPKEVRVGVSWSGSRNGHCRSNDSHRKNDCHLKGTCLVWLLFWAFSSMPHPPLKTWLTNYPHFIVSSCPTESSKANQWKTDRFTFLENIPWCLLLMTSDHVNADVCADIPIIGTSSVNPCHSGRHALPVFSTLVWACSGLLYLLCWWPMAKAKWLITERRACLWPVSKTIDGLGRWPVKWLFICSGRHRRASWACWPASVAKSV